MVDEIRTVEDDFGSFFDNLSSLAAEKKPIPADFGKDPTTTDPAALADAEAKSTAVTETPVVEPDTPTEPASGGEETGDDSPAATDPAVKAAPVAAPHPSQEELLARFVKAIEQRPVQQPQAPAQQQPQAPPLYNQQELARLAQVQKDWPDIMEAVGLALRGSSIATQQAVEQRIGAALAPTFQNLQVVQADHQYDSLRRAIPDYDQVADPVIQWARTDKSIPGLLRDTYERVITEGDVSEIKYLVDTWRTATGKSVANPAAKTPAAPAAKVNELSEAAKQAAASLAPVVSRRSTVVTTSAPENFEDAFDHWVATKA
jgi:hypothetical protein